MNQTTECTIPEYQPGAAQPRPREVVVTILILSSPGDQSKARPIVVSKTEAARGSQIKRPDKPRGRREQKAGNPKTMASITGRMNRNVAANNSSRSRYFDQSAGPTEGAPHPEVACRRWRAPERLRRTISAQLDDPLTDRDFVNRVSYGWSTGQPSFDSRYQPPTIISSTRYDRDGLMSGCCDGGRKPVIRLIGSVAPNSIITSFPSLGEQFAPYLDGPVTAAAECRVADDECSPQPKAALDRSPRYRQATARFPWDQ